MTSFEAPNGAFIGVETLPNRKKPCLTIGISGEYAAQIVSLATFKDQESADMFSDFLTNCHKYGFGEAVFRLAKKEEEDDTSER